MSNLTQVGISAGVPNSGTGTVSTIDALMADGGQATLGITTGAAVTTSVAGTIQGYLRGIVSLLVSGITVSAHAVTNAGTFLVQAAQSGTWTVQPGNTPNTVPWLAKIHDGTTAAKVAAASTLPVATDPAVIVTIRDVNANGSAISTNSAPVVIASDQAAVTTQLAASANLVQGAITTAMTGTTSTSLLAAPGAGLHNYVTTIVVSNSHATVGTDVIIQDGTGGTTLLTIPAAALYGGGVISLPAPLRQPTANTALYCANVTTGASTKVSAFGFKAA